MVNLRIIECNNILFANKGRLERDYHKKLEELNKEIHISQEECDHIPALVFYDTTYCVVCRKRLDTNKNTIQYISDGPLTGDMAFSDYIEKKIGYLQGIVKDVIKDEIEVPVTEIIDEVNKRIKEEEEHDREIRSYRKEI